MARAPLLTLGNPLREVDVASYRGTNCTARLAAKFSLRAGLNARVLELANPNAGYPAIRIAVQGLIHAGHIGLPTPKARASLMATPFLQHAIALLSNYSSQGSDEDDPRDFGDLVSQIEATLRVGL